MKPQIWDCLVLKASYQNELNILLYLKRDKKQVFQGLSISDVNPAKKKPCPGITQARFFYKK
jgi:hypothetical protein